MPTGAEPLLLDTSAAVALLVADHVDHEPTFAAVAGQELGLCGHAAFETFSVLTRLPGGQRLSPAAAQRLLLTNFPATRQLSAAGAARLFTMLSAQRVSGGAVHDALVAAAAVEHALTLVSRDRRAAATYERLQADVQLLE